MRRALIVLLSITALWAVDKKPGFAPQPAASYPGHQTQDKITIAAKPASVDVRARALAKTKAALPSLAKAKKSLGV